MAEENNDKIIETIDEACKYFATHPMVSYYLNKDYDGFKKDIELFNSFLRNESMKIRIEDKEEFDKKCELLQSLLDNGLLEVKKPEN